MPLKSGSSNITKSKNIKELMKTYKETGKIGTSTPESKEKAHKQAIAIAMSEAGKSKKKKPMTEAMEQFIDSLKTPKTESFLENVVKRGMKLCFEDATVSQVTSPDSTKTVLDTDKLTSDEIDVMQTELDTIKNQKADIEAKNAKLKEDQKKLQSTTQAMTVNDGSSTN